MVRYDTPTDGISRKKFDRAMDAHIRRHVQLSNEVGELRRDVISLINAHRSKEKQG